MRGARIRSVLLSKQLRLVTLIILLLRVVQTVGYVTCTMGTVDDARFMDYQTVSFATFVLAPLFLVMALCVVRTYFQVSSLVRLKDVAKVIPSYLLASVAVSAYFTLVINLTALLALGVLDMAVSVAAPNLLLSLVVELFYFLICSALFLIASILSKSTVVAVLVTGAYFGWDYVAIHATSVVPEQLSSLGWSVSVMAYYSPPMAVLPYLTRQLSILAFAVLALYLLIRWRGVEHVIGRLLVD